jgi:hypothetical protein
MLMGFRNIAIIAKIAVPATIIAVVSIGIVLYASLAVTHLSDTAAALVDGNATRVQLALQAESAFNNAAISEKNVILSDDEKVAKGHIELYGKATGATLDAIPVEPSPGCEQRPDRFSALEGQRQDAQAPRVSLRSPASEGGVRPFARRRCQHRQVAIGGQQADRHERGKCGARDASVPGRAHPNWLGRRRRRLICAFGVLGWIALYQISRPLA